MNIFWCAKCRFDDQNVTDDTAYTPHHWYNLWPSVFVFAWDCIHISD